jgi:DNA-binding NtrC family response regulator
MSRMKYQDALALVRTGRFRELINTSARSGNPNEAEPHLRVLLAYALALTGDRSTELPLSKIAAEKLTPSVRSQLETTLGIVRWHAGDHQSSWRHLQAGVRFAREANAPERLAWAYLHFLRIAIEAQPLDALLAMLREVRTAVIKAGVSASTAYLHVCVSTLEGQRGHLDEATRHCDIAASLLDSEPNAWLLGGTLINRSCIACLRCNFRGASEHVRTVIALTAINGSVRHRAAAEVMSGYLQFLMGDLESAQSTLANVLSKSDSKKPDADAADALARVYLAMGDLGKCESALELSGFRSDDAAAHDAAYGRRWASLTKAKWLLKRHEYEAAVKWLESVEALTNRREDHPFNAAVHLLAAQTLDRLGRRRECAHRIEQADWFGIRGSADVQGQFHHSIGSVIRNEMPQLAAQLQDRANRIWLHQGIVSVRSEIDDGTDLRTDPHDVVAAAEPAPVKCVINAIAAAFDLAYSPRLLGAELVAILEMSGCRSNVSVSEKVDAAREAGSTTAGRVTLRLGDAKRHGKSIVLMCDAARSPLDAIVVTDVLRIGRAAVELEKARQEERSRAALWPSEPIEEQAGALFVAGEMQTLLDTARRVAATTIPVLITGETGTGKEVLARLIHSYSPRAAKTFLPFNCSATPREMLDAQLFGHRKGAFTGASENFTGVIRAAAGGTLFLDEIGESTLDIQPKLLRFLESGEVHPIGDTHPQHVDVRVLAATNADIDGLVAQGRFREDLFYRLNIVRLHIPPVRERRVEIPAFANHYLQKFAKEMDRGDLRLSEETMEYLILYRWPGNVRQIANEMRRLAALAEPGAVLMPEHLSADIAASRRTLPASERPLETSEIVVRIDQPLGAAIQHLERTMIGAALARTSGVDEAAKVLGLSRKGLYLKRLRYGMEIDRPKNATEVA